MTTPASHDDLPVILVSAKSEAAASHIISEIMGDGEGQEEEEEAVREGGARVWSFSTKYYSARVLLQPTWPDAPPPHGPPPHGPPPHGPPPHGPPPHAPGHLIYLTHDEVCGDGDEQRGVRLAERRWAARAGRAVRVLALDAPRLPPALRGWAARRRAAPLCLRRDHDHDHDADHDDTDDECGVAALRTALQAHAWPQCRRDAEGDDDSSDGGGDGDGDEGDGDGEEDCSRQLAAAARLWAALGAARGVRDLRGDERTAAASALVHALAAALQR